MCPFMGVKLYLILVWQLFYLFGLVWLLRHCNLKLAVMWEDLQPIFSNPLKWQLYLNHLAS